MSTDDPTIVAIGASAGGIQALLELVAQLPPDFPGTLCIVVHVGAGKSVLPRLLTNAGPLPATHAVHGEALEPGHIYVAPPDYHLLIRESTLELSHGPRENHSRPAIDPMFRSAATAHGSRVVGVILSGALSDGSSGLMMIKSRGGTAIIQDPAEAIIESMPVSALRLVKADFVLTAADIGKTLASLAAGSLVGSGGSEMSDRADPTGHTIRNDFAEQERNRRAGKLTMFTCPDYGGTLWQTEDNPLLGFRCHVGHVYSVESLIGQKSDALEVALWTSVRMLEERATLSRQIADRITRVELDPERAALMSEQAVLDEQRADVIRQILYDNSNLAARLAAHGAEGAEGAGEPLVTRDTNYRSS